MLDVVGSTPQSLSKRIDFVASRTDAPILLDGVSADVRIKTLEYVVQSGIKSPIIYNSLMPEYKGEELEKIKEAFVQQLLGMYHQRIAYPQNKVVELESRRGAGSGTGA